MPKRKMQIKRIHFGAEVWTYHVGRSAVSIRNPQGFGVVVPLRDIAEPSGEIFHKVSEPSVIKSYIWRKLRVDVLIREPRGYDQAKESVLNFFRGHLKEI